MRQVLHCFGARRTLVAMVGACAAALALPATAPVAVSVSPPAGDPTVTVAEKPLTRLAQPRTTQARPNVVLILTDDMRRDDLKSMPAVRRLFTDAGTTFRHAYSSNSLCCPARATLLTGQYAHNHDTMGNLPTQGGGWQTFHARNDSNNLLPSWLKTSAPPRQRYLTYYTGKYLNGYELRRAEPDWDWWDVPIKGIYNYTRWTTWRRTPTQHRAVSYPGPGTSSAYQQRVQTQNVVDRIRAWGPSPRPFFIFAGSLAPHAAFDHGSWVAPVPEQRYRSAPVAAMTRSPAFNEQDLTDKPTWVTTRAAQQDTRYAVMDHLHRARVRSLRSVGDTVRAVVDELRTTHDLQNTILIFTSDNGYLLGEHGLTGKNMAYRDSVEIPLLIRGPGFRPGATVDQPVSLADVTATIVQAAGVQPARILDGVPLQGMDTDPTLFAERPVLIEGSVAEFPNAAAQAVDGENRFYLGAVAPPEMYVQYYRGRSAADREHEFYDHTVSPFETVNGWDPAAPDTSDEQQLLAWTIAHAGCAGASCQDPLPAN